MLKLLELALAILFFVAAGLVRNFGDRIKIPAHKEKVTVCVESEPSMVYEPTVNPNGSIGYGYTTRVNCVKTETKYIDVPEKQEVRLSWWQTLIQCCLYVLSALSMIAFCSDNDEDDD